MTWVSRENGDLRVKTPNHELPEIIASRTNGPVIGALVGETGPVVLAWESRQDKTCHLAIQVFPRSESETDYRAANEESAIRLMPIVRIGRRRRMGDGVL